MKFPVTLEQLPQFLLNTLSDTYYGALQVSCDLGRFPNSATPEHIRLFKQGMMNLDASLGGFMPWIHCLLMSRNAAERIADGVKSDPEEAGQWAELYQQTLELRSRVMQVARVLRENKSNGGFSRAAAVTDEPSGPEETSQKPPYEPFKRRNLQLMALEALAGVTKPFSRPTHIIIDITNRCNFRCRTCYQAASQDFIYHDLEIDALDSLPLFFAACSTITIGGTGEPLLSPDMPRLLKLARAYGINTELITNGSLLGRLKNIENDITHIYLSMDGASSETVDSIRRGARFEKIIAGIRELPPVLRSRITLNMVVCRANAHEIHALAKLARELGVNAVGLQTFHAYLPWHEQMKLREEDQPLLSEQLRASREELDGSGVALHVALIEKSGATPDTGDGVFKPDYKAILASLNQTANPKTPDKPGGWDKLAIEFRESTSLALPTAFVNELSTLRDGQSSRPALDDGKAPGDFEIDTRIEELLRQLKAQPTIKLPHCLAPYTLMYVNADSTIRPCCVIKARCGSLGSDSAGYAWNSPAYVALRRSLATGEDLLEKCFGCQDGVRFAHVTRLLGHSIGLGVDIRKVETPDDGCVPENVVAWIRDAKAAHSLKITSGFGDI
jgi:MoaA/NifB/PqqE/SkfB family radical SAM enzyme